MRQPLVAPSLHMVEVGTNDKGLKETKASVVKWSRDLGTIAGAGNTIGVSIGCGGRDEYDIPKTLRPRKESWSWRRQRTRHDWSARIGEYVTWVAKSKLPAGQELIRVEMLSGGLQHAGQRDRYGSQRDALFLLHRAVHGAPSS